MSATMASPAARDEYKVRQFSRFISDVLVPANNEFSQSELYLSYRNDREHQNLPEQERGMKERSDQVRHVVRVILRHFGMDPKVVGKNPLTIEDGNWLEALHGKICAIVPDCFLKIYRDEVPTEAEYNLMISSFKQQHAMSMFMDEESLRNIAILPFRNRGKMVYQMGNPFCQLKEMIEQCSSFGIPSDAVLSKIASYAPLIEVGAGTGYWSALLQQRRVDILPYDIEPPAGMQNNKYFDLTYTDVKKGRGTDVFSGEEGAKLAKQRALLIVWPNKPDFLDNPTLAKNTEDNLEMMAKFPIWDSDCLNAYVKAGGSTVIYVGEREENVEVTKGSIPESGLSSSRNFQNTLCEKFYLEAALQCPRWWCCVDDVTIWKRKVSGSKRKK